MLSISAQPIVQNFEFNDYSIKVSNQHTLLTVDGTRNMAAPGNPMQPYKLTNLMLPPGAEYTSIEIKILEKKTVQLPFDLMPMQYAKPISEKGEPDFIKNENAYKKACVLPVDKSIIANQERMNGYEILQVKFSPIKYNAIEKSVELVTNAQLIVKYKTSKMPAVKMLSARTEVKQRTAQLCSNPEVMNKYASMVKSKSQTIDALIITPAEFSEDFQPLMHDYEVRGLSTTLLTMENIETNYQGSDLQEKIRNAIIEFYQNSDVKYVLLGGDVEHIPHRGFYCHVQSSSVYEDNNIPADLYYMALDGNWNNNGDENWGEPDEDDLIPEVALSRMPFTTHEELAKMLNKIMKYTNEPVTGELNNPLLAGEHLYDAPLTWGAQYLDLIHGTHDDNGYTTSGIPDDHPYDTLYDRDATWSSSEIIAEINNGHPFIHHVGHSNTNYAMRLYNSDITNSNFDQVDGETHNFPLIYTHGCICGAFDDSDCIAEEMLQIDNFAVAFVGNSRYGWFNEGQTEGPSQHIHREFVDALYSDGLNRLAEAHMMSKIETSGWVEAPDQHEYGAIRWCFYDCNALGDPALPIWTNDPREISTAVNGNIYIGESSITVNVSENAQPVENANLAIVQNDIVYGTGISDENGVAEITLPAPFTTPGEIQIITSGYNILKDTITETLERPNQAYLIVSEIDLGGDVQPVYGQDYNVNLLMENVGESNSEETIVEISSTSEFVSITNGTATVSPVTALQQELITGCFNLQIDDTIEDGENITFQFDFYQNDELLHSMEITKEAIAPKLSWNAIAIDDNLAGNGNGIFDPGEIIILEAIFNNKGSIHPHVIKSYIINNSKNITILTDTAEFMPVGCGATYKLQFAVQASGDADGTQLDFTFDGNYDNYTIPSKGFNCIVGQAIESFESGDFNTFAWQNDDLFPWQISDSDAYEGEFCSRSFDIDDDETSEFSINIDVPEGDHNVSFMYKVSCEEGSSSLWDYLEFAIDDATVETWDGEIDWSYAEFPITQGNHTLTWRYVKDYSVSHGDDCAWVDQIMLPIPGSTPPTGNSAPVISSANQLDLVRDEPFSHNVTASDADGDNMTANMVLAPSWIQVSNVDDNNWTLSGNVPLAINQIPDVVLAVGDGYEYTSQVMNVTIDGVNIERVEKNEVDIYPIPAKDNVFITLKEDFITSIRMISINGKTTLNRKPGSQTNTYKIDTENMQNGLYLMQIETNSGQTFNKKIIINK